MKNLLKLNYLLILSVSFFLASCSQEDEGDTAITMRNFAKLDAGSDLPNADEIKSISNEVSDNLTSTIFKIKNGKVVPFDFPESFKNATKEGGSQSTDDFEVSQVFLKQSRLNDDHTFLYRNNSNTNATHTFTGKDVIGIDMNYNGDYVRMSDINVFSQSQDGEYSYAGELGVGVFANESTGKTSSVYYFPILSNENDPGNSFSGMWMRIVLDFNQGGL